MRSLFLSFLPQLAAVVAVSAANLLTLKLPGPATLPETTSSVIDPALASFSIETAFFIDYLGNVSSPNLLTINLLENLKQRAGVAAQVRIGGITADSTFWNASQQDAIFNFIDDTGALINTTIGPAFFEAATTLLPEGTKVVMNLDLDSMNYTGAFEVAQATLAGLERGQTFAFELGNEPDHYGSLTPQSYASVWSTWSRNLSTTLGLKQPEFQLGATADDPIWPYNSTGASSQLDCISALAAGANEFNTTKTCSEHTYQYSVCDPTRAADATLPNLVNHTRLAMYLDLWQPRVQSVRAQFGPDSFVIGEYNSVSCSGKANVSNTFGQALWLLDTTLYAASINVSRLYIHQGGPLALQSSTQLNHGGLSLYDLWYPIDNLNGNITVFPSYSAYLFVADLVSSSSPLKIANIYPGRQANLSGITTAMGDLSAGQLVAYGIWDSTAVADSTSSKLPSKLALINMQIFNQTQAESGVARPNTTFDISAYLPDKGSGSVRVRRLQAPGADVQLGNETTWAGQSASMQSGVLEGNFVEETIVGGQVVLSASEAALVFLQ